MSCNCRCVVDRDQPASAEEDHSMKTPSSVSLSAALITSLHFTGRCDDAQGSRGYFEFDMLVEQSSVTTQRHFSS